jgi:AcrR family transcriptional regulator
MLSTVMILHAGNYCVPCKVETLMIEHLAGEPGRRERKKSQLRRALQRAALRLAEEHGYEHLTAEGIAAACDVSTRTFFNYFSSKDEALFGPVLDRAGGLRAAFDARPASESPIESLRAACVQLAGDLVLDPGEWQTRRHVFAHSPQLLPKVHAAFADLESSLAETVADRLHLDPKADPYPALLVGIAITSLRVAIMHSQSGTDSGADADLPALVARLFELSFPTIAPVTKTTSSQPIPENRAP